MRNFRLPRGGGEDRVFDTMAASAYVKMLQHYHVSSHGILVFFLQESKLTSIRVDYRENHEQTFLCEATQSLCSVVNSLSNMQRS